MNELYAEFRKLIHPRLLVIGDIILDRYSWGNADRVSPEAPVLILKIDHREVRLGGVASVAYLAMGLEAEVTLLGVVGDDASGRIVQQLLTDECIDSSGIQVVTGRQTTTKERFMGRAAGRHANQILRVDEESTEPIESETEDRLLKSLHEMRGRYDAVLISDYGKGVCTSRVIEETIECGRSYEIPVIVDPARCTDFSQYRRATLIKPNRIEAEMATGLKILSPTQGISAAEKLVERLQVETAVVTLDCDGMVFASAEGTRGHISTNLREVYDITGAGDMSLAVLGIAKASAMPLHCALQLANVAAGLEVERHGVTRVYREEIATVLSSLPMEFETKAHAALSDITLRS